MFEKFNPTNVDDPMVRILIAAGRSYSIADCWKLLIFVTDMVQTKTDQALAETNNQRADAEVAAMKSYIDPKKYKDEIEKFLATSWSFGGSPMAEELKKKHGL